MKITSDEIYLKIQQISIDVKEKLKRQGVVVPIKKRDGSIQIGSYSIKKDNTGFYSIVDFRNEVTNEKIVTRRNVNENEEIDRKKRISIDNFENSSCMKEFCE